MIRAGRHVKGARSNVLGLTFKENVPDLRNSRGHRHHPRAARVRRRRPSCTIRWRAPRRRSMEYGVRLCGWKDLPAADALVLAVSAPAVSRDDPGRADGKDRAPRLPDRREIGVRCGRCSAAKGLARMAPVTPRPGDARVPRAATPIPRMRAWWRRIARRACSSAGRSTISLRTANGGRARRGARLSRARCVRFGGLLATSGAASWPPARAPDRGLRPRRRCSWPRAGCAPSRASCTCMAPACGGLTTTPAASGARDSRWSSSRPHA